MSTGFYEEEGWAGAGGDHKAGLVGSSKGDSQVLVQDLLCPPRVFKLSLPPHPCELLHKTLLAILT